MALATTEAFIIQVTALRPLLGMANNVSLTIQVSQETFVAGAKTLTRKAPFHLTLFWVEGEAEPHQTVLRVYSSLCVQESLLEALGGDSMLCQGTKSGSSL